MVVVEEGEAWFFAYHCGICYEGGGQVKTHQIIDGGFQKL